VEPWRHECRLPRSGTPHHRPVPPSEALPDRRRRAFGVWRRQVPRAPLPGQGTRAL